MKTAVRAAEPLSRDGSEIELTEQSRQRSWFDMSNLFLVRVALVFEAISDALDGVVLQNYISRTAFGGRF
jgi:hypothetical protein